MGYMSLLIGFFLNENSSGGALIDFKKHYDVMLSFNKDLNNSLLNYHLFDTDHSPLFITTILFFTLYFEIKIDVLIFAPQINTCFDLYNFNI